MSAGSPESAAVGQSSTQAGWTGGRHCGGPGGLCFGSKRLWRKQQHLEQNGYASHAEWLRDWRDARSNEFFVLGSRDETSGCQLCVASIADDGSLTLRLRMPDCLAEQHGKYLVIPHVRFAYGHGQALAALASNAEYAAYRRKYGDQAARSTSLGQAISYRFKLVFLPPATKTPPEPKFASTTGAKNEVALAAYGACSARATQAAFAGGQ